MTHNPPEVPVREAPRSLLERLSLIWLVPLLALLISLGVAWRSYSERGPLIAIAFNEASGIRPGETELRFRDVTVGLVEEVGFSASLEQVVAYVRLEGNIADYVDSGAQFWVVEPEVTTQGVSGLETVLSGVFIEGIWDTEPGGLAERHVGLAQAPLQRFGQEGLTIRLVTGEDTVISEFTPILYKGITVGRVGRPELAEGGNAAQAEAVIFSPYDQLVTTSTRFWDASGFSFSIGAGGASVDFSSLAALISGGVAFETMVSGGVPAEDGARFDLYVDEAAARSSIFSDGRGEPLNLTVIFSENVSGLSAGAPVELGGIRIGEVANLTGLVDPERFGDDEVRLLTTIAIRPQRLGLPGDTDTRDALDFLAQRVENGLRARLATASILTGGLKVELVDVDDPAPAALDVDAEPYPVIPAAQSDISDASATAEGVFERINELPIEELIDSAIGFLDSATRLAANEQLNAVPGEITGLVSDIRGVVGSQEVQAIPEQVSALLSELQGAASDLRRLTASLEEADAVNRLLEAVDAARQAAQSIGQSTDGVPALVDRLTAVAADVEDLPLSELVEELTATVEAARALISSEDTAELPGTLNAALAEVEAALADLRAGGAVENLNETLASARAAAAAVEQAAADLPGVVERLDGVLGQADTTLSGFAPGSDLTRDARAALRDLRNAADAIESLARTLERDPSSIIRGR